MYGMVGKLTAHAGRQQELVEILLRAADVVGQMPGCHLYVVTKDVEVDTAVHIMEIWDDKSTHDASLQNSDVRALIAAAMPLLDGAPSGTELTVVGGYGMPYGHGMP